MYDEACCEPTKECCETTNAFEARTQRCLPDAVLLARRLSREFSFKPHLCIQAAAQHFNIDFYTLEQEFLKCGLL